MKRLFKWVLRLVLVLVALTVLLLLFKDPILRVVIENRIRARTGLDAQIGKYSSSIFSPVMTIRNLRLYNTPEFGGTLFVEIPEIHLELDGNALMHRQVHVTLARFHLAELDIIRNQAGATNLYSIIDSINHRKPKRKHGEKWLGNFEFTGIDMLDITLGKGRLIDMKDSRNNCETVLDLRDQVFKDIKTEENFQANLLLLYWRSHGDFCFLPDEEVKNLLFSRKWNKILKLPKSLQGGAPPSSATNRPGK
jgi:hypothetical protein